MIKPIIDENGKLVPPTMILCHRNKSKIGQIFPIDEWDITVDMNQLHECSFKVYKNVDGVENPYWSQIIDCKLIYLQEYDIYLEIEVDKESSNVITKSVVGKNLGIAETSQTQLYDIEINTSNDIINPSYTRATIWSDDVEKQPTTILGRVLSKMPHYKVKHVDASLYDIFKEFTISDESVCDFLSKTLAEEVDCLTIIESDRTVSLYDLEDYCPKCKHREADMTICPECGNTDIVNGYGNNTSIYMSLDNICKVINVNTNKDEIKNTFKVSGGDDFLTNTVRSVNPNGTDYIYRFSQEMYDDMSPELREKLISYFELYDSKKEEYSNLYKEKCKLINDKIYLQSGKAPDPYPVDYKKEKKNVEKALNGQAISLASMDNITKSIVETAIVNYANAVVDIGYETKILDGSTYTTKKNESPIWQGVIRIYSIYEDDPDKEGNYIDTDKLTVTVNDDYETFIQQKIKKSASKKSVKEVYNIEYNAENDDKEFKDAIKQYNLDRLTSFYTAYEELISVLKELGASKGEFKKDTYDVYLSRQKDIQAQIKVVEGEIKKIDNNITNIDKQISDIQTILNIESYLGDIDLYYEFLAYRREDTYQNTNYISEDLNDAQRLEKAQELLKVAEKELYKASETQYEITTTIGNLFAIKEFEKWRDNFDVGNWMRIYDGEQTFKLRLLSYDIKGKEFSELPVTFSNVDKIQTGYSDIKSVLSTATSMSSSYNSVKRQAAQSVDTAETITSWTKEGVDAGTMSISDTPDKELQIGSSGIVGRIYDDITDNYLNEQIKISSNVISITDDNWQTIKTALGKITFTDSNGTTKTAYGLLAEVVVGQLILGNALEIYNSSGGLTFGDNGLEITNKKHIFRVNPNNTNKLISLSQINKDKTETDLLYIDNQGNATFNGRIEATTGHIGGWKITNVDIYEDNDDTATSAGLGMKSNAPAFWAGSTWENRRKAPFRVDHTGVLHAEGADISGTITTDDKISIYNTTTKNTSDIKNGKISAASLNEYSYTDNTITVTSSTRSEKADALILNPLDKIVYTDNIETKGSVTARGGINSTNISAELFVGATGAFQKAQIGTNGALIKKIDGNSTVLENVSGTSAKLISSGCTNKDIFFITNGDGNASDVHIEGTTIIDGACYVLFNKTLSNANVRVNWIRFTLQ